MLSCDCGYGDYDWYVRQLGEGFQPLATKYSRKCYSCKKRIAVGDTCLVFAHYRNPQSDYEERRFGYEVYLKNLHLCEACGEIWLNLRATGLCVEFGDMREALQEYWDMTGFDPKKYAPEADHA